MIWYRSVDSVGNHFLICVRFLADKATFIYFYTVLLMLIKKNIVLLTRIWSFPKKKNWIWSYHCLTSEKFKIVGESVADRFFIIRKNHRGSVLWTASVTEWLNVCWFYPWLSNSSLNHKIVWIYDSSYQRWVSLLTKLLNFGCFFIDSHIITGLRVFELVNYIMVIFSHACLKWQWPSFFVWKPKMQQLNAKVKWCKKH